jgi:hypothetical protein
MVHFAGQERPVFHRRSSSWQRRPDKLFSRGGLATRFEKLVLKDSWHRQIRRAISTVTVVDMEVVLDVGPKLTMVTRAMLAVAPELIACGTC